MGANSTHSQKNSTKRGRQWPHRRGKSGVSSQSDNKHEDDITQSGESELKRESATGAVSQSPETGKTNGKLQQQSVTDKTKGKENAPAQDVERPSSAAENSRNSAETRSASPGLIRESATTKLPYRAKMRMRKKQAEVGGCDCGIFHSNSCSLVSLSFS
jgi:hypothetical protein